MGNVYIYSIALNEWSSGTANSARGTWDLSSIFYEENVYIIGFDDSIFYKYNPVNDNWTELSKSPYHVGVCAMGIIDNLIYCVGGNEGGGSPADNNTVIVYNINTNQWKTDSLRISKRHWMTTAEYRTGLYILGGINSASVAVNTVEEIIPQGTSTNIIQKIRPPQTQVLYQNYPNSFNPSTIICFTLTSADRMRLRVYIIIGQLMGTLVDGDLPPGNYSYRWPEDIAGDLYLPSGVYFYVLETTTERMTKKMILNK